MGIDFEPLFSDLAGNMKASEIRELLKLTARPNLISFAGGLPNPKAFPIQEIREIADEVLTEFGPAALQYGATEGVTQFRDWLKEDYAKDGEFRDGDELVVTNGAAITAALTEPQMDVAYEDVPLELSVVKSNEAFFSNFTKGTIYDL